MPMIRFTTSYAYTDHEKLRYRKLCRLVWKVILILPQMIAFISLSI